MLLLFAVISQIYLRLLSLDTLIRLSEQQALFRVSTDSRERKQHDSF